jgi:PhzF family phenazine biosynthesis protein
VLGAGIVAPVDDRLVQECGAGNLPLRVDGDGPSRRISVEAPEAAFEGERPDLAPAISEALGRPIATSPAPTAFRNGPNWLFVRFEREEDVASLKPDMSAIAKLSLANHVSGLAAFSFVGGGEFAVHIRCFAPAFGVPEDPVTGSANAALPAYLARHGLLDRTGREYVATQATELGRDGRVHVRLLDDTGRAEIGGQAVTVVEGEVRM